MPIKGVEQPEQIVIDTTLRLRKTTDECAFALAWYQDKETLLLVDGEAIPYDMERLMRMYHYLAARGEVYFIEVRAGVGMDWEPIGDVSFWQNDMPIVIGCAEWRGQGIGSRVVQALVERAKTLGYPYLEIGEIYDENVGSRTMFERIGFRPTDKTERGHRYRMDITQ